MLYHTTLLLLLIRPTTIRLNRKICRISADILCGRPSDLLKWKISIRFSAAPGNVRNNFGFLYFFVFGLRARTEQTDWQTNRIIAIEVRWTVTNYKLSCTFLLTLVTLASGRSRRTMTSSCDWITRTRTSIAFVTVAARRAVHTVLTSVAFCTLMNAQRNAVHVL